MVKNLVPKFVEKAKQEVEEAAKSGKFHTTPQMFDPATVKDPVNQMAREQAVASLQEAGYKAKMYSDRYITIWAKQGDKKN